MQQTYPAQNHHQLRSLEKASAMPGYQRAPYDRFNPQNVYQTANEMSHWANKPINYNPISSQSYQRVQQSKQQQSFFPFGQDRARLYRYVTQQMDSNVDEENKKMLQKFRIEAVKHRNQRVMAHIGKMPYITQSMMPAGFNIKAHQIIERPSYQTLTPMPLGSSDQNLSHHYAPQMPYEKILLPQTAPTSPIKSAPLRYSPPRIYPSPKRIKKYPDELARSVSISVEIERETPKSRNNRRSKRYRTVENEEQKQTFGKIKKMLRQINSKLKQSSQILCKSLSENVQDQSMTAFVAKNLKICNKQANKTRSRIFFDPKKQVSMPPTFDCNPQFKKKANITPLYSRSLKQHLLQLRKNRKRLDYIHSEANK